MSTLPPSRPTLSYVSLGLGLATAGLLGLAAVLAVVRAIVGQPGDNSSPLSLAMIWSLGALTVLFLPGVAATLITGHLARRRHPGSRAAGAGLIFGYALAALAVLLIAVSVITWLSIR
jgi:hypothetical protein